MKIQASNPQNHKRGSSPGSRLVRLQPSRFLWIIIRIVHCLVICAIWLAGLSLAIQLSLSLIVSLSLAYAFCQQMTKPSFRVHHRQDSWYLIVEKAPASVVFNKLGSLLRLKCCYVDDGCIGDEYRLVGWSYCSVFLAVVQIENRQAQRRHIPIFSDCCEQGEFRWLRVVIKYLL